VLVLGRLLTGLAHTLVMVGSLTAVLQDRQAARLDAAATRSSSPAMLGSSAASR